MKALSNIGIGSRLSIGFAIVLLMSIVSTSFALINARSNAQATTLMMEQPLAKERLVSDLYLLIYSAIERTTLIAKSSDETLSATFAESIAEGTRKGAGLLKQVEGMLAVADEKRVFEAAMAARGRYQEAKKQVMEAKQGGDAGAAAGGHHADQDQQRHHRQVL